MSCGCNSNPCSCQPRPSVCCNPTVESQVYTFENANMVGIGVFDNETDFLVQYRGLVSLSAALTLNLNVTDKTIEFDFDDEALVEDIPTATTTQRGIAETATNAEALAKAANDKILTPSNLAALGSTQTFAGLVELATNAETIAGVSTTLAVTPAGLLAAGSLYGTVTFADAVARGAAVPAFAGQFGTQLDTDQGFVANGTVAGSWLGLLTLGTTSTQYGATSLDLNGSTMTLHSGSFVLAGSTTNIISGSTIFSNATLSLEDVTTLNFDSDTVLQIDDVSIPADSVLMTGSSAGVISSLGVSEFLSSENTQVWGTPSGTPTRTAFTTYGGQTISNPPTQAEVQAMDDALVIASQHLGALITDLMNTIKPHAT